MASKTKKVLGSIAQWGLPIIGSLFGPIGGAIGGAAGGALSGKTGTLKQMGIGTAAGAAGGYLSKAAGGAGGILSKLFGGGGGGQAATAATAAQPLWNKVASPTSAFSGMTSAGPGFSLSSSVPQPTVPLASGSLFSRATDYLKKNPMTGLGIGSILGSQLLPNPRVPDMPQSFEDYRNTVQGGGSAVGQLGQNRLTEMLNTDMTAATEDELNAATHDLELAKRDEIEQIRDLYRNVRPGSDPTTDSAYRRDLQEVTERYDRAIAQSRATLRRDVTNQNQQQRLREIATSSGLNQEQMNQLAQIAQWDLGRVMTEFDMDYNQATQLKDMLMGMGYELTMTPLMNQFQPKY